MVLSFLAPGECAAIPDAFLAGGGGGGGGAVLVVEGRAFGATPLAERCHALGAVYVGGEDVLSEVAAAAVAWLA